MIDRDFGSNLDFAYQKLREELTAEIESVQFHNAKIEQRLAQRKMRSFLDQ